MEQSTSLEKNLTEFLQIDGDKNKHNFNNSISNDSYFEEVEEEEDEEEEDDLTAAILAQSGYAKSDPPEPPSIPLSVPPNLKLVSAMKGSREKQGIPARNLTVNWAAGVYDPPPTAGTLVPRTSAVTIQQRIEKKMNKQKPSGKADAGVKGKGKGKDKKQVKKFGGSSNRCFNSLDDDDDYGGGGW